MSKIVKIDCGDCGVDTGIGSTIARFTYDDGGLAYICAEAFPSKERMIADCNEDPVVSMIIGVGKDAETGESNYAKFVTEWTPVWVDKTLRAV